MTAPEHAGTDVAVVETPEQKTAREAAEKAERKSASAEALANLKPEQRAEIMLRRQANIVSAQIAGTNWGKGLDADTRRAVGDWGNRNGIDVTKEIFILGGNIYLNAEFYLARLATLIEKGRVLDWRQSFINDDPRLRDDVPAERAERELRRQMRIRHNVPENATSAVLSELYLVTMPHTPLIGVKWAPRTDSDPIGAKFPQETALTRSARRALKQGIRYVPELASIVHDAEEDAAVTVNTVLEAARDRQREVEASQAKAIAESPGPVDATRITVDRVPVPVTAVDNEPDPYTGTVATSSAPAAAAASAPAPAAPPAPPAPSTSAAEDEFDELTLLDADELARVKERQKKGKQ